MIHIDQKVFALAASGDTEDLKRALQYAVELEHSTLPPYLYARYSLGTSNRPIRTVLRSIARDEMTHLLLAGNILKAVGGAPAIDHPGFIPSYPGHLPGSVAGELVVPLEKFSKTLVETIFMRIEQPEHILEFDVAALALEDIEPSATIGEFYRRIRQTFEQRGDEIIVAGAGADQPGEAGDRITSARDAIAAINRIVEEGEGTETDPAVPDGDGDPGNDDLAHYYRFAELVKGKLKRNPAATPASPPRERYIYDANDPVAFDPGGVIDFPANPRASNHAVGSPERIALDGFNRLYTSMLQDLHQAFNGAPQKLDSAVDSMRAMSDAAGRMAQNLKIGPSFEFLAP